MTIRNWRIFPWMVVIVSFLFVAISPMMSYAESPSSRMMVVGNKDSKRYHLPGMPHYNNVQKYHRVYFDSEQKAIDSGYYKAGTGRDLSAPASKSAEPLKETVIQASAISPAGADKSSPETLSDNKKTAEIKKRETPENIEAAESLTLEQSIAIALKNSRVINIAKEGAK